MNIKSHSFTIAILAFMFLLNFLSGCSNESDKLYKENMEQGEEHLSQGMHKQAAEKFLAAAQAENTSYSTEKFKKAVQQLYNTCVSLNPTTSDEIANQFNDWVSSAPTEHLHELLFISAKNPTEISIRENAITILRERLTTANWEEKLSLELAIVGIEIRSIEISSLTIPSRSRSAPSVEMETLNLWLPYNCYEPDEQTTKKVVEVLKKTQIPDVDAVMYGITNENGVRVVKICDVQ